MRPFRFLADVRSSANGAAFTDRIRHAEAAGYHGVAVPDHLMDQLSPVATMAAVAMVSSTLRISAFVLNNDLRHPAVLAQDLATIDVLSSGRLDVAIGAGWNRSEYDAIGLPFSPAPKRQARLTEAIAVLKGCFRGEEFAFAGDHYAISAYTAGPASHQRPHPPFFIGGGGKRTLTLAATEADTVGLAPRIRGGKLEASSLTWDATVEKIGWVRAAAGDRFDRLEFNTYPSASSPQITDSQHRELAAAADRIAAQTGVRLTERELEDSPHVFIGSVDRLVEKFEHVRAELGISSFLVGEPGPLDAVVQRLSGR